MSAALHVIQSPEAARRILEPDRLRMLELLAEPDSAAGVARRLQLPRQTVNYHLRELEKGGFLERVGERRKGNCMERLVRASARSYVISPAALGALGGDVSAVRDRFSSAYLVAAAARAVRDLSALRERADRAGKRLATLTIEAEVRFASPQTRRNFTEDLQSLVAGLVAKYHDAEAEGGRSFRLLAGCYPKIAKPEPPTEASVRME